MRLVLPLLLSLFTSALALKGASVRSAPGSLSRRRAQEEDALPTESGPAKVAGPKENDEVATLTDKKAPPPKDPEAGLVSKDKAGKKKDKKDKKEKKCKKAKKEPKRRRLQADTAPVQPPDMAPGSIPGAGTMAVPGTPDASVEELPYCLHGEKTARVCEALKEGKPPKKGEKKVEGDLSLEITHDGDKSSEEVAAQVGEILRSKTPTKFLGCTGRRRLFFGGDKEEDTTEDAGEGVKENEVDDEEEESVSVVGLDFGTLTAQECESRGFLSGSSEDCGQVVSNVEIFFDGKNKPTTEEKADMFDLLIATIESLAAEGAFDEVGTVQKVGSSASSSGSGGATVPIVAAVVAAAAVIGGGAFLYKKRRATKQRSTEKGGETDQSDDEVVEAHVVMVEDEEYKGKDPKKKKYGK